MEMLFVFSDVVRYNDNNGTHESSSVSWCRQQEKHIRETTTVDERRRRLSSIKVELPHCTLIQLT